MDAKVFIHSIAPCIAHASNTASPLESQFPVPMFEFFFDIARAVINLFRSGTVDWCPNIRFTIPHAGGALPPLMTRFIQFSRVVPGGCELSASTVDGKEGGEGQSKAFVEEFGIGSGRLMSGSDFPFTQTRFVETFAERMRSGLQALFGKEEKGKSVSWECGESTGGEEV
jgi:hypothetical protein